MIRFAAHVACDRPGCSATGELPVRACIEGSCSYLSSDRCRAELEAETYGNGWHELTEGRVLCDACMKDPFRFEVRS